MKTVLRICRVRRGGFFLLLPDDVLWRFVKKGVGALPPPTGMESGSGLYTNTNFKKKKLYSLNQNLFFQDIEVKIYNFSPFNFFAKENAYHSST